MKKLIGTVQPFDARMFKTHRSIAPGTRRGLEVLEECARLLLQELRLEGYALGLSVKVQVRGVCVGLVLLTCQCAALSARLAPPFQRKVFMSLVYHSFLA